MKLYKHCLSIALSACCVTPAIAELHDRGNGLVYDDILNVTWIADFDLPLTLGYDPVARTFGNDTGSATTPGPSDSFLTHDEAKNFAADINTASINGQTGYLGVTTWQLPTLSVADLSDTTSTNDGSTNKGYNITRTDSPLAHLYYVSLGATGNLDATGTDTMCKSTLSESCLLNTANDKLDLFSNVQAIVNDSDTASTLFYAEDLLDAPGGNPVANRAWGFVSRLGFQGDRVDNAGSFGGGGRAVLYASGDIAPPPGTPAPPPAGTLEDRGEGLVYDTILDVTWAADFDLATTLGYDPVSRTFGNDTAGATSPGPNDGYLSHDEAKAFVQDLNTATFDGQVGYKGITTWQLPTLSVADLSDTTSADDGSTNKGYNITRTDSPLSHLYYVGLGAIGNRDEFSIVTDCQNSLNESCLINTANASLSLFDNLAVLANDGNEVTTWFYNEDLLDAPGGNPVANRAWAFVSRLGFQGERVDLSGSLEGGGRALVYAPGDASAATPVNVPLPWFAIGALGSMLVLLGVVSKSTNKIKS